MEPIINSACSTEPGDIPTGNVTPLLHEIRHALQHWLDAGEPFVIDLRSLPMGPGEEQRIIDTLGEGEVHAQLSALGPSEVVETGYPGVWLVTHYNNNSEIIGRFIEVIDMPWILRSQEEDIREGLARLAGQID